MNLVDTEIHLLSGDPADICTLTWRNVTASFGMQKHVRHACDMARIAGAEVEVHEAKGWFSSSFAIRLKGTPKQLLPTVRYLRILE